MWWDPAKGIAVNGRKLYDKQQIVAILHQYAQGVPVRDLTARYGVSRSTIRRWRLHAATEEWRRTLEQANRLLKRRVGDLSADKEMLQRILRRETTERSQMIKRRERQARRSDQ